MTGSRVGRGTLCVAMLALCGPVAAQDSGRADGPELPNLAGVIEPRLEARIAADACVERQQVAAVPGVSKSLVPRVRDGFWAGTLARDGFCAGFHAQRITAVTRLGAVILIVQNYDGQDHVFEGVAGADGRFGVDTYLRTETVRVSGRFADDRFTGKFSVAAKATAKTKCRAAFALDIVQDDDRFAPDFGGDFNGRWVADRAACGGAEIALSAHAGRVAVRVPAAALSAPLRGEIRRNGEIDLRSGETRVRGRIFPDGASGEIEGAALGCAELTGLKRQFGVVAQVKDLGGGPTAMPVPVVVIPGIAGSTLVDSENPHRVIWGDVQQTLDHFKLLRLPPEGAPRRLVASDLLRTLDVPLISGDFEFYQSLIERLEALGYREGRDLFLFPYDWRQSNLKTADLLADFLDERGLTGRPIDVFAHSMGGLVTRIYLQRNAERQKVRKFIAMGTPHYGSAEALLTLLSVATFFGPWMPFVLPAGDLNQATDVFWSFESLFELLPTYPNCCFVRYGDRLAPFDATQADAWTDSWLIPGRFQNAAGLAVLDAALARVREVRALVDKPLPAGVDAVLVVNDQRADATAQLLLNWDGIAEHKRVCAAAGSDGTVIGLSARDDVPNAPLLLSKREHEKIFDDPDLWLEIEPLLIGRPDLVDRRLAH